MSAMPPPPPRPPRDAAAAPADAAAARPAAARPPPPLFDGSRAPPSAAAAAAAAPPVGDEGNERAQHAQAPPLRADAPAAADGAPPGAPADTGAKAVPHYDPPVRSLCRPRCCALAACFALCQP
jgi:hypothetical protein